MQSKNNNTGYCSKNVEELQNSLKEKCSSFEKV
jgi:hypothetical protein